MAQKKGQTELADQFEGGVSSERAMLDIQRGIIENLYHESIGLYTTATPKNLAGPISFTKTGVVAFDRVRNLPGKDYVSIAKGEGVIEPHVGNVDTIQIPLKKMLYNAQELSDTDLTRLQNDAVYRAKLTASMTRTFATNMDCELFDLLLSAAAGKKDSVIEFKMPEEFDPASRKLYFKIAGVATKLEQQIDPYNIGINRSEICIVMDPTLYTETIAALAGAQTVIEKTLGFIQNEKIQAAKITGLTIIRHPFLNNKVISEVTSEFGPFDFTGIRALIYHVASPFIVQIFNNINGVINKDTGNYRMIQRVVGDKGLVYGNLIRVIKEPSSKENPFDGEKKLVEKRDNYNNNHGFRDGGIVIPETVEELQKNYLRNKINLK